MNIRLTIQGDTLSICGVRELNAENAGAFRDQIRSAMSDRLRNIEIDLSQAVFMDSCGLGALISLHRAASNRSGLVRLLNPAIPVRQLLELTRMRRIFEIVEANGVEMPVRERGMATPSSSALEQSKVGATSQPSG
jgi:anti-sigma B factor antagonist